MSDFQTGAFGRPETEIADFARALSHPGRIAILRSLSRKETLSSGEICSLLPLAQSTVSQHLLKLVSAGLVILKSGGAMPQYALNREAVKKFEQDFSQLFK